MEEGRDIVFAHGLVDGGRDAVGLGGAAGGGVDGLVAFVGGEGVEDIHGVRLDGVWGRKM